MDPIRVLLAVDHTLVRAAVRALFERLEDIAVVAEAADGSEALRRIEMHRPDTAVRDIAMPKLTGLDVAARVADRFPSTRVIILTMHIGDEYVRAAITAGVSAYLLKDCRTSELETAIRAVVRGRPTSARPSRRVSSPATSASNAASRPSRTPLHHAVRLGLIEMQRGAPDEDTRDGVPEPAHRDPRPAGLEG